MATTRDGNAVAGGLPKTVKFDVTADNDVIISGEDAIILGVFLEGLVTALNIDEGADITAIPFQLASTEDLCVTASGAGSVTVVYAALPQTTYTSYDT